MSRTLILGGIRSGKSLYAEKLLQNSINVTYIALAQIYDDEMAERVLCHQKRRKASWETIETNIDLVLAIEQASKSDILIDSIGTWISNVLMENMQEETHLTQDQRNAMEQLFLDKIQLIIQTLKTYQGNVIIVSEEVGYSMVSDYPLGRLFTDIIGMINQRLAKHCDFVYLMAAGYPILVKDQATRDHLI